MTDRDESQGDSGHEYCCIRAGTRNQAPLTQIE